MNSDKVIASYSDLVNILYDLTSQTEQENDYIKIAENLDIIDKLSTILKRLGETNVLDKGVEIKSEEKEEGEMIANK